MKSTEGLGHRMKQYEAVSYQTLPKRIPVIIRIDGRNFHTLCKRNQLKGWDFSLTKKLAHTAIYVMSQMQGCNFAYCQSDEISFLLTDYKTIRTEAWFNYEIPKLISITASLATSFLSGAINEELAFDCRAFSVPHDDVCNYFIWRQKDATRNAISMLARQHFSHKQLHKVNCNEMQELLFKEKNINFNDRPDMQKRGICIVNKDIDYNIPIFTQDRNYVEQHVDIRTD